MANPKLATLVEAFTAPTLDTRVWNNSSTGQYTVDTVNHRLLLNVGTTAGTYYRLGALGPYDATGSSLYAEVNLPPNGAGTNGTRGIMKLDAGSNNYVQVTGFPGGLLRVDVSNTGTVTTTNLAITYDPHQHRWWRLAEVAGSFVFSTSPDGFAWTDQATVAYTWDATAVGVYFQTGATVDQAAGLVAEFAHINTHDGGPFNLAWPLTEVAWGPAWGAADGAMPNGSYVDVTDRTRGTVSVQRGRQYELDQVRSGEASVTLANDDAALDPVNEDGPWAGHIAPYQPFRTRAQWPPTRNLVDQVMATGGDLGPYNYTGTISGSFTPIQTDTDSSGGSFVTSPTAWRGTSVLQFAVPSGTAAGRRICYTGHEAVHPGQTYTVQLRVRNVTASTSLSVQPTIRFYTSNSPIDVSGTASTLTGSATAGWTYLTVTATAPANVTGLVFSVATAASAAADVSVQVDGVQLEKGAVATTWTCPGVWYSVYAGWTERWPSTWDMDGLYGLVEPTAVDTFSLLSQRQLADALTMELNAKNPRFVYKLDDPQGSTTVTDWTGNNPPAPIKTGKYGAGSITFGTSITASDTVNGVYTGSSGTVATVTNSNPGTGLVTGGASFISLGAAGIVGPADLSQWTRMIAFRWTGPSTITTRAVLWSCFSRTRTNNLPGGSQMWFWIDPDGYFRVSLGGPASGGWYYFKAENPIVNDGNWHLALVSYNRDGQQLNIRVDNWYWYWNNIGADLEPTGLISDNVGSWVDPTVGNGTTFNFKGDISFLAEFPTALSTTDMYQIYSAWRDNCAGESTNSRYNRILRYAGYRGRWWVEQGLTTSMGPAAIDGQDAMSALQAVVDTEGGAHYVDADGTVTFRARSSRYNAATPVYTFGERVDLGEWPYEDCQLDYDSTHLSNQVTVVQEATQQQFYASDDASSTAYFPRTMQRTINATSGDECQDAANYLLSRYKQPATRVSSLKLHPSANPALWPVCLSLELGTRIRVMRRPPGAPPIQVDAFVENIQWEFDDDGEAWLTLQCSPADLTLYAVLAAWHTTLASSIAAGAKTLSINAPQTTTVYKATFDTPGTWRVVTGGVDAGPITVVSDAGTTAAKAVGYTVIEDQAAIPYDPTKIYRVSATVRTPVMATTGPGTVYIGLTGIDAKGNRCNINGANAVSSQYYCAASGAAVGDTYTTFTGYITGTAIPGIGGQRPDQNNPGAMRPEVVAVRPLVYLLYNATDGVQYVDSFTIQEVPVGGEIPAASQLAPGQKLVLGQNTANAETVTVASVGATSPGWTTATITLTAATTKPHAAGDVLCEPLPAGGSLAPATTDPTTWDDVAQFDQIAFSY
jgi:hypothetical protein